MDIIQAIHDPNIIGDEVSPAQDAALRALYGLPLKKDLLKLAKQCTSKTWIPGKEYGEAAFICGRRSGKSDKLAANCCLYEAFFRDHQLSPGETGIVLLLAQNMRQARIVKGYIEGKINKSPILHRHVIATRALEIELDNRITIAIHPSSFRAIRGLSVVCAILDEAAYWFTEFDYANPDVEVVRAVRPSMATFPHAKLILVSSPYAMSGVLWDIWQQRNKDKGVLVWHAPTELMNPTVTKRFLDKEKARDPENYRREYLAEFTDAISSFLSAEAIRQCVSNGRTKLLPDRQKYHYSASIDAAFKGDCFTICIAHPDDMKEKVIVDYLGGWQGSKRHPVRLSEVMPQIKALADQYGFEKVHGDQFGAEPLKHTFERYNLTYEERSFTSQSKADIYATLRALITDGRIELLDHEQSLKELRALELELLPGGALRIGHPGHGKARDDYADAIALTVSEIVGHRPPVEELVPGTPQLIRMSSPYDGLVL